MKNTLSKISYLGVKSGIDDMKKQFDYKEYGGAVMLGVKKPVIKSHGWQMHVHLKMQSSRQFGFWITI